MVVPIPPVFGRRAPRLLTTFRVITPVLTLESNVAVAEVAVRFVKAPVESIVTENVKKTNLKEM